MGIEIKSIPYEDFNDNEALEELQKHGNSVFVSTVDSLINWGRSNSVWPLTFATSCCGIEMMAAGAPRHDFARFGIEVYRASPRQADVIVVAGTIVRKMAPVLKRLYDQMADPKYVIAMGACAISGGPFFYNSYSVIRGVDQVIPVDVFIPGCPPRPEALLYGVMQLQRKIKAQSLKTGKAEKKSVPPGGETPAVPSTENAAANIAPVQTASI
jgi:NADH-quinone oxidoreductase subunit B